MLHGLSTRYFRSGAACAAIVSALVALGPTQASAQYYHRRGPSAGAVAAGVVGGLALGALAAGAARPYYAPGPVYMVEEPLPPPPPRRCWYEREDVWDGYGYRPHRIRVCH